MKPHALIEAIAAFDPVRRTGRVTRIAPTIVEADGPSVPLGTLCEIAAGDNRVFAEVVGLSNDRVALAPFGRVDQLVPGALVEASRFGANVPVGDAFLGRAVDALGLPVDGGVPVRSADYAPLKGGRVAAFERGLHPARVHTGIRAIDGVMPLATGQRIGLFAASGVGKTSLVGQMACQIKADRTVFCLVGERAREVKALWSDGLDEAGRRRSVMVAATSDEAAALRVRAIYLALALARHWAAQGQSVVLFVDSITRLALALREVGLSAGEPPTVRGFPPRVFATIPAIVEQCGTFASGGSITAVFTVLSETDDVDDPICEFMKSLVDGHIVLARELAGQGHYPAIDVLRSISRNSEELQNDVERRAAQRLRQAMSAFASAKTLIETGLYTAGSDPAIDEAIRLRQPLVAFLRQSADDASSLSATTAALHHALGKEAIS